MKSAVCGAASMLTDQLSREAPYRKSWTGQRHGVAEGMEWQRVHRLGRESQERGGSSDAIPIGRQGVDGDSEKW